MSYPAVPELVPVSVYQRAHFGLSHTGNWLLLDPAAGTTFIPPDRGPRELPFNTQVTVEHCQRPNNVALLGRANLLLTSEGHTGEGVARPIEERITWDGHSERHHIWRPGFPGTTNVSDETGRGLANYPNRFDRGSNLVVEEGKDEVVAIRVAVGDRSSIVTEYCGDDVARIHYFASVVTEQRLSLAGLQRLVRVDDVRQGTQTNLEYDSRGQLDFLSMVATTRKRTLHELWRHDAPQDNPDITRTDRYKYSTAVLSPRADHFAGAWYIEGDIVVGRDEKGRSIGSDLTWHPDAQPEDKRVIRTRFSYLHSFSR